jgi:CHAT domain-containing protein
MKGVFKILVFLVTSGTMFTSAQNKSLETLDSIYALQAVHYKSQEYNKIIELSHYAKKINLNNAQDSILMARITAYIGYANNKLNTFYESIEGFEEALIYIPAGENPGFKRTNYYILYDLMTRYYSLKRYKKALSIIEQAESILYNNPEAFSESNFSGLHQRKFRIYCSLGYFDNAQGEVEKIKRVVLTSKNLSDENLRYGWMRYYRTSLLSEYYKALYIKENQRNYVTALEKMTPEILKNIEKLDSIYYNTEMLQEPQSRRQFWNLSYYLGALYYTADYFKEIEDNTSALDYINRVIQLSKKANEPVRNVTEYLRFKANLLYRMGNRQEAITLIDSTIKNFSTDQFNVSDLNILKGDIYADQKKLDSTLHYYKKAVDFMHNSDEVLKSDFSNFSTRYQFPADSKQIDHISFMLLKNFENNEKAEASSRKLNDIAYSEFLEGNQNLDLSLGNKQLFYNIIENRIYLNQNTGFDKEAFLEDLENISNQLAWKKFSQSRNVVQLPVIDSLEGVEYEISKQLLKAKREQDFSQKDSLQNVLEKHQSNVAEKFPSISSFTQNNFDFRNFQNKLSKDQVVLMYLFFLDQFAILEITKEDTSWHLKPWTEKEKKLIKNHLESLSTNSEAISPNKNLTDLLIPEEATDYKKITIVPDTPIYNLPFETLWFDEEYLVMSKQIYYSSHLRFMFLNTDQMQTNKTKVTIFAPDYPRGETSFVTRSVPVFLEGAQKEAVVLEKLFPSNTFIGKEATKQNFVEYKTEGNILHLAMHASLDEKQPTFSHFNFSKQDKLYLEELYALKIPADLAVLSACNTGVGKMDDISGMASLQRAFNYAGTKATIASLWEVPDDATSQIMISFYEHLKEGQSKSSALQKAKIDYLENTTVEKLKHPYYWAGFVLYGDDSPVVESSTSWIWFLVGFALVVVFLMLFRKFRKAE